MPCTSASMAGHFLSAAHVEFLTHRAFMGWHSDGFFQLVRDLLGALQNGQRQYQSEPTAQFVR